MTSPTVELADGMMPFMWSTARVTRSKVWAARGRAEAPGRSPLEIAHGIPTFVGDDIDALRSAARANLALFTTFPFYQRMFRVSGFAEEAAKAEAGAGGESLSDRMLDATLSDRAGLTLPRTTRGVPRRRCRSADPVPADRRRRRARGHPSLPALSGYCHFYAARRRVCVSKGRNGLVG
jgi:hypothetical protein